MAPAVVYLHIGSPKTGTTYLQGTLWANQDVLAADGVLLGRSRAANNQAIGDLLKWQPSHGDLPKTWRRLRDHAADWDGRSLVLSQEHLHKSTAQQFAALVESFPGARFQVVLTARDLARSVPAQWQSSVRQRFVWTLGEYADLVAATPSHEATVGAAEHFWRRQDTAVIVDRFVARLSTEHVRVVTVPSTSRDPDELWWRFVRACDLGTSTTPGEMSHESLGAASAEIMRRLNALPEVRDLALADYKKALNHALSRHSLAPRRSQEPGLVLPERHRAWAEQESERLIEGVAASGVEVVGDLADLRPRASSKPSVDPEVLAPDILLEAALAGLAGMSQRYVEVRALLREAKAEDAGASKRDTGASARPVVPAPSGPPNEPDPPNESDPSNEPAVVARVLRRLRRRG